MNTENITKLDRAARHQSERKIHDDACVCRNTPFTHAYIYDFPSFMATDAECVITRRTPKSLIVRLNICTLTSHSLAVY